jgi:hypothetical protein
MASAIRLKQRASLPRIAITLSFSYTFEVGNSPLTTRQNAQSVSKAQAGGTGRPWCALIMKDVMEQEHEVAFCIP